MGGAFINKKLNDLKFLSHLILVLLLFVACTSNQRILQVEPPNVLQFGADPSGLTDSSVAFQEAIDKIKGKVIVPKGKYRVDATIKVHHHLFLESGVEIVRIKGSENEGPVFWLNRSHSVLEGETKTARIKSEVSSPNGIIKIGHAHEGIKGENIFYCHVKSLRIEGSKDRSHPGSGLLFFNSQERGDLMTTCYFNQVGISLSRMLIRVFISKECQMLIQFQKSFLIE